MIVIIITVSDKSININEFTAICTALFRNENGKPYKMDSQQISDLFMIFNVSGDGSMSKQEFVYCWNGWITKVRKRNGLLVIWLHLLSIPDSEAPLCPGGGGCAE